MVHGTAVWVKVWPCLAVLTLDAAYVRDAAPADALPWKPRPTAI